MNKYNQKSILLFFLLTLLIIAFIWTNSCMSRELSGAQSGRITRFLQALVDPQGKIPQESFHHFVRKAAHFTEFALLGLLVGSLFRLIGLQKGQDFFSLPVLIVLLVAVLDEYIQYFADRGSAVTDVVLDFCGGLFGLGIVCLIIFLGKKK